jgi:BirA family biotin operon repressor/biotin-[acetyl-CoA-carboxylase] ligase
MPASFDLGAVEAGLGGTSFAGRVTHLPTTGSTNTLAILAAQEGAAGGVWVADEQTAGRGRGGHTWHSAAGDGLYVSVLLRPRLMGADALKLSLAAGLAAQHAVAEAAGIGIDLRWPNDLMVSGGDGVERKFGGILTESAMDGGDGALAYAVVGIGMNLNHPELPQELRGIATSLRMVCGERVSRERVLVALLRELESQVGRLESEVWGGGKEGVTGRFERASTWVRGLRVRVDEEDGYTGVTDGLNERGLLRVLLDDGTRRVVRHGGVRRAEV